MALKLSQSVVAKPGVSITKISKSELLNWKFCLVSEKAAIFAKHGVLFVTVQPYLESAHELAIPHAHLPWTEAPPQYLIF